MKLLSIMITLGLGLLLQPSAIAGDSGAECSIRTIAGKWLFATGVGRQLLFGPDITGDITALGTMNIDKEGIVSGTFDVTVSGFDSNPDTPELDPLLDIGYGGSVTVNPDCTGTLVFETDLGAIRTDSIAIVARDEIWGMSQDGANLWTYKVRKIQRRRRR